MSGYHLSFLSWFSEVGCPPGRLYRECERGEGCPFNCAQVSLREGCYSDGCEEGCHCPPHTYQHNGTCLKVLFGFHLSHINILLHCIIKACTFSLCTFINTWNHRYEWLSLRRVFDFFEFCCDANIHVLGVPMFGGWGTSHFTAKCICRASLLSAPPQRLWGRWASVWRCAPLWLQLLVSRCLLK